MSPRTESVTADPTIQYRHGAKALIKRDDRVLLIQERHEDGTPFWTLPGGGLEEDESPPEALHRELKEELCCSGSIDDPVGRFRYAHQSMSAISIYDTYECTIDEPIRPNPAEGVFTFTWAPPSEMPDRVLPPVRVFVQSVICGREYSEGTHRSVTPAYKRQTNVSSAMNRQISAVQRLSVDSSSSELKPH